MDWVLFSCNLWKLCVAHAVTDCFLQDPKLFSVGFFKNPYNCEANKTFREAGHWPYWLLAHGLMNGLGVAIATSSSGLGIAETLAHIFIDYGKMQKWYNVHMDQAFHLLCKLGWAYVATT